jgi:hypothetical protein
MPECRPGTARGENMKTPILALAVAAAAFASSSLYLWSQLRVERDRVAQVEETTRQLNVRIGELERARIQVVERRSANAGGVVAGQFGQGVVPDVIPATSPQADAAGMNHWMVEPPKLPAAVEKTMRSQVRANNRQQYGAFLEEIGLGKEMSDQLIALLSEQDMTGFDLATSDAGEMQRQMEQVQREHDAEIADLIGAEKAQALKEYRASLPARAEVELLAQQLDGNDVPLNPDQRKKLQAVFIEERARVPMPNLGPGEDTLQFMKSTREWQDEFNNRVGERANHILNSEQLAVYNEIQQWQNQARDGFGMAAPTVGYAVVSSDVVQFSASAPVNAVSAPFAVTAPAPSEPPKKKN